MEVTTEYAYAARGGCASCDLDFVVFCSEADRVKAARTLADFIEYHLHVHHAYA